MKAYDHPIIHDGLRYQASQTEDIEFCGGALNGREMMGRKLNVNEARPRTEGGGGGGGGWSGGGGGGRGGGRDGGGGGRDRW